MSTWFIRLVPFMGVILTGLPFCAGQEPQKPIDREQDVVVYGGTAGGVAAAVQAARMGKRAVLVTAGTHVGGLTSGGLGATDIGNKEAIGGISREFYARLGKHYADERAWRFQKLAEYKSDRQATGAAEMWTFEPHVAEQVLRELLAEAGVPVLYRSPLLLERGVGVTMTDGRIRSILLENGTVLDGRMFIDASYEGDLMAKANVSYAVGREANARYGETLNGVQTKNATKHQFTKPVDPYLVPGNPGSGLLPGVQPAGPGAEGEGDHRVQAYNFRLCLTDHPENRVPFPRPLGYDPLRYELGLRYIRAGAWDAIRSNLPMPNRKTDLNNNGAFSTDNIGMNYDYPEGDYATRDRIFLDHVTYQQGLLWFLANDPRVPEEVRKEVNRWGLSRDEFTETGHWPHQLYVREARRMVSDYVMTQHDCQGREVAKDPVGLAAYTMDSHNTQRYVKDGKAINEGDVQVGGFAPYPISYRSLVPAEKQCTNLFVPVCLSASHIAYGSIRMEPVFMVLGQSAATAAVQAIEQQVAVQKIDYKRLQSRLRDDKQVLEWTGARPQAGRDPARLPGIVRDDAQAELTGDWPSSAAIGGFVGVGYRHDGNEGKGSKSARFVFPLEAPGRFEVRLGYTADPNRATNVPVTIVTADGEKSLRLNEREKPPSDGFRSLGTFRFDKSATVVVATVGTDGYVVVDAVQLLPTDK